MINEGKRESDRERKISVVPLWADVECLVISTSVNH